MGATLMSSEADPCSSADDIRKAESVLVHHWFDLARDVVEIDSDSLLIKKVEALDTHLGILGGCSAGPSTPCLRKFLIVIIADVFLLFLLLLQKEDAVFLLFLVNLILDDLIKVKSLTWISIDLIGVLLVSAHTQVEWVKNFGVKELDLVAYAATCPCRLVGRFKIGVKNSSKQELWSHLVAVEGFAACVFLRFGND